MTQQTWFITGVNSGFGRILSEKLLERGDRVAGTTRKLEQLQDLKAKYGERLWLTYLDLTDTPGVRQAVDAAFAYFGGIDVVVNNAGYGLFGAAEEVSDERIRHQDRHQPRRIHSSDPRRASAFAGPGGWTRSSGVVHWWTGCVSEFQPLSHDEMGY